MTTKTGSRTLPVDPTPLMVRRRFLMLGSAAVSMLVSRAPTCRAAAVADDRSTPLDLIERAKPTETKVILQTPDIAENGNTVPVTVTVDSPMTATDYVEAIHVVAEKNPKPLLATFQLTPASGRAEVQLRVRLSSTQTVTAIAQMSDGSLWKASHEVKVTIGGCGGG